MICPERQDDALLADIRNTRVEPDEVCLWWLGQSGFLLKHAGGHALIDPYLSDTLTRKYAGTDKPHERLTARCIDPAALGFVDLLFSTHGHTDHFDRETIRTVATASGRTAPLALALPAANLEHGRAMLRDLEVEFHPFDAGHAARIRNVSVTATPAAHTELERDEAGRHRYLGYVLGFGARRIYHSGDTIWHEAVVAAAAEAKPHVALLPINGHDPARGVAGNLAPAEAAALARRLGVDLAIPCHYEMFAFNTADPTLFLARCADLAVPAIRLQCGGNWHSRRLPASCLSPSNVTVPPHAG